MVLMAKGGVLMPGSPVVPVGCGVVGCGDVSGKYLETLLAAPIIDVVACCDVDDSRAGRLAASCRSARAKPFTEVLADPAVELLINLTPPQEHSTITRQAIRAGKAVYSEKPFTTSEADLARLMAEARAGNVLVGGAPDTQLGPAAQAARRAIDEGLIGRPLGATAALLTPGHERSAAAPEVFYRRGAGPLLDMGVYYLTMLVGLLGPVRRAFGMHSTPSTDRVIDTGPAAGTTFSAEVATHVAAVLEFANGAIATLTASFEVWATGLPHLEIYGTEGVLTLPDPNFYGGDVVYRRARTSEPVRLPHPEDGPRGRGIGVVDMAHAVRGLTPQRMTGALVAHVLEVMLGLTAESRGPFVPGTTCDRPHPLPRSARGDACWWCPDCEGR
jgi:predicted dehydrogenase